jgi:hypothetical protein
VCLVGGVFSWIVGLGGCGVCVFRGVRGVIVESVCVGLGCGLGLG